LVWGLVPFRTFVLITIVCGAAVGVFGILRRRRAARRADRRADHVLGCCVGMAGDLAAGQPPITVLERAAADWPELAPVAVAGRVGADVPTAFRELARRPGAGSLRTVAASWQVAEETGAGLAAALHRAADSIRAERRTARLVAAELAAARATARMLAVLPVGVLLMGAGIGGDPVGFLLHHPLGLACLGTGAALSLLGLRWLEVIADRVLR
jgi:tight adherence protein B